MAQSAVDSGSENGMTPPVVRVRADVSPRLSRWVRAVLVLMALGFVAVFITAAWLSPYTEDGEPRRMATHRQLGLPECSMITLTGKPCPSCGMTTSFSLLVHADPVHAWRANWVGVLLALSWAAMIPWGIVSAWRGRSWIVRDPELAGMIYSCAVIVLLLARWGAIWFAG
ncbi:MAG: DUF2752 domain-containing protein [Gemmataceae bacterium]